MIKYLWEIVVQNSPVVLKNCPKCGYHSAYQCSSNFRVNANQKHIDVWLIYLCQKCSSTWNMEILSRRDRKTIDKELYAKFLQNDPELARHYAFDPGIHTQNKAVMDYGSLMYEIQGNNISLPELKEAVEIEIICKHTIDLRLDKLLGRKLQLSREQIKRLETQNRICVKGCQGSVKNKVKNGLRISILP